MLATFQKEMGAYFPTTNEEQLFLYFLKPESEHDNEFDDTFDRHTGLSH